MTRILWVRGAEYISYNRPSTFFCLGTRGSGKSTFLEHTATEYLEQGHAVLDLFGSRDGEGLAWLRSPHANEKKILLLHGENVDVQCSYDTRKVNALNLEDFNKYDLILSSAPLYSDPDSEFDGAADITSLLYKRRHWQRLIFMIVREASNLYFSRLKIVANQTIAKSEMVYLIREARHCGTALGLDSLRFLATDIDVRSLSDYVILKSQGLSGLNRDLSWLYSIFKPSQVQNMPKKNFIIISKSGAIGLGEFPALDWHKQEREDIVRITGLKIEYGEKVDEGKMMGTFKTIGDSEHAEIVRIYAEEGIGMCKLGVSLGRSGATVRNAINAHDAAIKRSGFCFKCRRVKGIHEGRQVRKDFIPPKTEGTMAQKAGAP